MALPHFQRIEAENIGDVTVVHLRDKKIIDQQNIQVMGEDLFSLVDEFGCKQILLNFANVEYLSSAALGKLMLLNNKVNGAGGRLILCNINPQLNEVFEITKFDKFFTFLKDADDPDGNLGGLASRLKSPKSSGGGRGSLRPPRPQ